MDENSTLNNLILYYFNELGMTDSVLTQQAIDSNFLVHEEFEMLKETIGTIQSVEIEPAEKSICSILAYSKSLS
ncbi:MAG TPA: hypothetical protein PKH65_05765 [Bacteroidia bacterium]|nr:hypothetical protein [Bacteroidia bacterium]HNT80170.1 hypothetical protein [Bacteroidia bacterium]